MLKTIKQGDTGVEVKVAQYLIGWSFAHADGIFSETFESEVKGWQKNHSLPEDGIIGPDTWKTLSDAMPTVSTSKYRKSNYAAAIQVLVDADDDGIFGPKTKAAVASYQATHNLSADGIVGPLTRGSMILGETIKTDFRQPTNYLQSSKPWGPKMYSSTGNKNQTYSNSACGPTAMADIVSFLIDALVTPYTLGEYAIKRGDRSANNGTNWSFFDHITELYPKLELIKSTKLSTLKSTLDAGGFVVCSMGPGYWTSGGHYICAWKYDGTYIYCNDPATTKRTRQKETDFIKQRKKFFCFKLIKE